MQLPAPCPEIPVSDFGAALDYYRDALGFTIDWSAEDIGLAGISRGAARIFMATAEYRVTLDNRGPIVLWLNLDNRAEVDVLHAEWSAAGAIIAEPPVSNPYSKLHEFHAQDPDGNILRVFYDFGWEER